MKKSIKFLLVMALTFFIGYVADAQSKDQKTSTVKFVVNLHCEECKQKIEKAIPFEKGVKDLNVDMKTNVVTINYIPSKKTNDESLKKALQKLEFQVKEVKK